MKEGRRNGRERGWKVDARVEGRKQGWREERKGVRGARDKVTKTETDKEGRDAKTKRRG